jgi:hypothetical protein
MALPGLVFWIDVLYLWLYPVRFCPGEEWPVTWSPCENWTPLLIVIGLFLLSVTSCLICAVAGVVSITGSIKPLLVDLSIYEFYTLLLLFSFHLI